MAELPTVMECGRLWSAPPLDAFWRWSADASAIEWRGGGTLLLRAELTPYAEHRVAAHLGLPPLQGIVFLFALLRDRRRALALVPGVELPPTDGLWERVRDHPTLRRHLVDCAMYTAPNNQPTFAARVAAALASDAPPYLFRPRDFQAFTPAQIAGWLQLGLRSLTEERLTLLARTGVADVPEADVPDLPVHADGAALLRALADDHELAGLAAVARRMQAALRLPHARLVRDETPTGGFAGITNRGPLDRLMPSELAHDDEVLAVRVATNEALYAQREAPPYEPRTRRLVLLDAGVRMWGTPRVLGVAVALALRASAPAGVEVEMLRAEGTDLVPVDLGTRAGIVRQLERIDRGLDVRAALPALFEASEGDDGVGEPIVVTHAAAAADPAFRAKCVARGARCQLVTVDEHGELRLLEVTPRGVREVVAARLDVRALQRRTLLETPAFDRQLWRPLQKAPWPVLGGVAAVGTVDGRLVLQGRRGFWYELRRNAKIGVEIARRREPVPAAACTPLAPTGTGPRITGDWGRDWIVHFDPEGLLHFVPRAEGPPELSVRLSFKRGAQGWCSAQQRELSAHELLERLGALAREREASA